MLSQITFLTLLAAGVLLWMRFFRGWFLRQAPLLEPRMRIQSPIGLTDVGILFFVWISSQAFGVGVGKFLLKIDIANYSQLPVEQQLKMMTTISCCQLVFTMISLGIIALRYGYAPRIFGWQTENILADLKIGVFGFLMIAPIIMTLQALLTQLVEYDHETLSMLSNESSLFAIAATWFSAVLVAPITEEIFFRGILLVWLQRQGTRLLDFGPEQIFGGWTKYGSELNSDFLTGTESAYVPVKVLSDHPYRKALAWSPIVISSFLFAGVHIGQGLAPIPLFLFGLALGYAYRQTGSILPCIVMHFLLNATSMLVYTVSVLTESGVAQ